RPRLARPGSTSDAGRDDRSGAPREQPTPPVPAEDVGDALGEGVDWHVALDAIRSVESANDPHRAAWPHVQTLAGHAHANLAAGEPGPIAVALEALIRDPMGETPFVRGALLLAIGGAYPAPARHNLAGEVLAQQTPDSPNELARAAWLVMGMSAGPGVDLARFKPLHSKTRRGLWPVSVRGASAEGVLDRALAQLQPTALYGAGDAPGARPTEGWAAQGTLTREVIVLAHLAWPARSPGPIRNNLLEWAVGTDMSHACIWSLCLAARDDDGLAETLRDLLETLDPSSSEGTLLAELLAGLAHRGDLVFDLYEARLTPLEMEQDIDAYMSKLNAIFALGAMIESENSEVAGRASDLLAEVALNPGRSDDVRRLTLVQLAVSSPVLAGDLMETILISPESAAMRRTAATLARSEPAATQQRMRDAMMDSFRAELPLEVRESYVHALIALGGDDTTAFLRNITGTEQFSRRVREELEQYLSL
ncbi:MAG: hypothetical protein ACI8QZ_002784, partial [Chlamydiales bacterium]